MDKQDVNENQLRQLESPLFKQIQIHYTENRWKDLSKRVAADEITDRLAVYKFKLAKVIEIHRDRRKSRLEKQLQLPLAEKQQLYSSDFQNIAIDKNSKRWRKLQDLVDKGAIAEEVAEYRYKFGIYMKNHDGYWDLHSLYNPAVKRLFFQAKLKAWKEIDKEYREDHPFSKDRLYTKHHFISQARHHRHALQNQYKHQAVLDRKANNDKMRATGLYSDRISLDEHQQAQIHTEMYKQNIAGKGKAKIILSKNTMRKDPLLHVSRQPMIDPAKDPYHMDDLLDKEQKKMDKKTAQESTALKTEKTDKTDTDKSNSDINNSNNNIKNIIDQQSNTSDTKTDATMTTAAKNVDIENLLKLDQMKIDKKKKQ